MTDEDSETPVSELQGGEENELPVIQLCGLVEELSYGNSALKTETEMFEKYYNKLEPGDQRHPRLSEIKISGAEFAQLRGRRRSKSRIGMDRVIGLSCDQKCELVQKELEDMKDEIRHMRANAERDLQHHEDRAKAEAVNQKLRKQLAEFRAPQVMLYVREKVLNGDLEKTVKMWERKVEIAEMSLKGYRKAWNKMKTTNEQLQAICPPEK